MAIDFNSEIEKLSQLKEKVKDCNQEPIHAPGQIQPHGVFLAVDLHSFYITHVSENIAEVAGIKPENLLNLPLEELISEDKVRQMKHQLKLREEMPVANANLFNTCFFTETIKEKDFNVLVKRIKNKVYLELEPVLNKPEFNPFVINQITQQGLVNLQQLEDYDQLYNITLDTFYELTGFSRILIYKFDENWNGDVIAERRKEKSVFKSFLGLHFPASDIPEVARKLYNEIILRLIPDCEYKPVRIVKEESAENLDLSGIMLRSVSLAHLEYLREMGVTASMSLSLFCENKLWGLIICHHNRPHFIPYNVRLACELLSQVVSSKITAIHRSIHRAYQMKLSEAQAKMAEQFSFNSNIEQSLKDVKKEILQITSSSGFMYFTGKEIITLGDSSKKDAEKLKNWLLPLLNERGEVFHTNNLNLYNTKAKGIKQRVSGVLAVPLLTKNGAFIAWTRPEVIQTIRWGGRPEKRIMPEGNGYRYYSRNNFKLWEEKAYLKSLPWTPYEIETAKRFSDFLTGLVFQLSKKLEQEKQLLEKKVLERTKELKRVNKQLKEEIIKKEKAESALKTSLEQLSKSNEELESFAYITSHDLQEPLRVTSSFSQLLQRRYNDRLDDKANSYLYYIVDGTSRMQHLIKDLLNYSRIGRKQEPFEEVDLNKLVDDILDYFKVSNSKDIIITKEKLPTVFGNSSYLFQLFQNLISNAIKYRNKEAKSTGIYIDVKEIEQGWQFSVRDNGIGIEKEFHEQIFLIFKRLHTMDEFEGTGIGLALCKKIVELHGGKIWVESELNNGSTFYFTIKSK